MDGDYDLREKRLSYDRQLTILKHKINDLNSFKRFPSLNLAVRKNDYTHEEILSENNLNKEYEGY